MREREREKRVAPKWDWWVPLLFRSFHCPLCRADVCRHEAHERPWQRVIPELRDRISEKCYNCERKSVRVGLVGPRSLQSWMSLVLLPKWLVRLLLLLVQEVCSLISFPWITSIFQHVKVQGVSDSYLHLCVSVSTEVCNAHKCRTTPLLITHLLFFSGYACAAFLFRMATFAIQLKLSSDHSLIPNGIHSPPVCLLLWNAVFKIQELTDAEILGTQIGPAE